MTEQDGRASPNPEIDLKVMIGFACLRGFA
jgi:hypothetical protein